MDPISLIMFGLIAVLIFFMFRNGKKRQQAQQEMQNNVRPGAQVMLQSGIFGTIESVDEEENRLTIRSGDSSIVVHRNAIGQIVTPSDAPAETPSLAPDDDPEFGERMNGAGTDPAGTDAAGTDAADTDTTGTDTTGTADPEADAGDTPKA